MGESAVALLAPVGSDTFSIGEDAIVQSGAADFAGTDALSISEQVAALIAGVGAESLTVTEAATALPVVAVATDALSLAESAVAQLLAIGSDTLTIGEGAVVQSGTANIAAGETMSVTESAVAVLAAVGADALSASDAAAVEALLSLVDTLTVSESALAGADLMGVAEFGSLSLSPRITIVGSGGASQITVSADSTYITADSTLVTVDGGYLGDLPTETGARPVFAGAADMEPD